MHNILYAHNGLLRDLSSPRLWSVLLDLRSCSPGYAGPGRISSGDPAFRHGELSDDSGASASSGSIFSLLVHYIGISRSVICRHQPIRSHACADVWMSKLRPHAGEAAPPRQQPKQLRKATPGQLRSRLRGLTPGSAYGSFQKQGALIQPLIVVGLLLL